MFPYIIFFIVSVACITGMYYYKKFSDNKLYRYFIYFLCLTFLTEFLGNLTSVYYDMTGKVLYYQGCVYNPFTITVFFFFFWFYYNLFKSKKNKKIVKALSVIYIIFLIVDFLFLDFKIYRFNTHIFIFGSILLLITIILFLIEIVNDEKVMLNFSKSMFFWITVGLLFFYVGNIPIMITQKYLNYNNLYAVVLVLLNVVMYGSFIIGFIKSDPNFKY